MKTKYYLVLVISSFIVLGSCKKEKQEKEEEPLAPIEVNVESSDNMKFNKNSIDVKKGQTIKLTFKNVGKLPKEAMGHNLVVLKKGTDIEDFSMEAFKSKSTDYIPASRTSSIHAHTKLTGSGESDLISFQIDEAGEYDYICSFPGHSGTEKGKIKVK